MDDEIQALATLTAGLFFICKKYTKLAKSQRVHVLSFPKFNMQLQYVETLVKKII
jgi:hypothetical protein